MMRIGLDLLRLDPVLMRIEGVHGEIDPAPLVHDLQPLPLDPVPPALDPDLMRLGVGLHQISPNSHHPEVDLMRIKPVHRVRDRERRAHDLDSHHLDP